MFCNYIPDVFPWNIVTANRGAKITVNSNHVVSVLIKQYIKITIDSWSVEIGN